MANTKKPKFYFSYNDGTPTDELADCIIQECEYAGLEIVEDEERASKRGYDHSFEVTNPAADKLKQILEICEADAVYDWDSNMENNPQDEFKAIAKIIKE